MKHRVKVWIDDEIFEFNVYDNQRWFALMPGFGGITLSKNLVFVKRSIEKTGLIRHEAVHVQQARKMGWKYLPTYLFQAIRGGFNRSKIPMEIEAYAKEENVFWQKL